MNKNSDKKLQYYLSLLDMSYMEVIKSLLKNMVRYAMIILEKNLITDF